MTGEVLVLNSGSSSIRAALFDRALRRPWFAHIDRIGRTDSTVTVLSETGSRRREHREVIDHERAIALVLQLLSERGAAPAAIGHRIVHGGEAFEAPVVVTPKIEREIERLVALAPLHLPANLRGLAAARGAWPDAVQVACFDTAFHSSMPERARRAALPETETGLAARRFGFHGLSYEYLVGALARDGVDVTGERIVIAHLGAGASLCAVKEGRSVETTMGFSTLSGLPMSTRSGDVDPGALIYLLKEGRIEVAALQQMLYERSGLAAIAPGDMQDLLARRDGDPGAAFAVEYFCYHVRRQIGALTAVLGGIDRLVFTGGVGANAAAIRAETCAGLEFLGVVIDRARNETGERTVSAERQRVTVQAIAADEESVIASYAAKLVDLRDSGPEPGVD
jgi:acetate kinase